MQHALAVRYQRDPAAREDVVLALLPLARRLAHRYWRGGEPLEDLEQVAVVGLLKALNRFDPAHGASFAAYAIPTISGELRRHFRDNGWAVHVPRATKDLALRVNKAEIAATNAGRYPTPAQLAEQLGVSIEAILEARLAAPAMRTVGLDQPPPGETGDGLPPIARFGRLDGGYDGVEQRSLLKALTSQLSDRNREILVLRYAGELPQSEIARRVGSSQMTVSRILRRSIAELQATLDDHAGRDAA